jgi:hypothetical protein
VSIKRLLNRIFLLIRLHDSGLHRRTEFCCCTPTDPVGPKIPPVKAEGEHQINRNRRRHYIMLRRLGTALAKGLTVSSGGSTSTSTTTLLLAESISIGGIGRNVLLQTCAGRSLSLTSCRRDLMEFFDDKKNWGETAVRTGRSWKVEELRIKSNTDLHKLWYFGRFLFIIITYLSPEVTLT